MVFFDQSSRLFRELTALEFVLLLVKIITLSFDMKIRQIPVPLALLLLSSISGSLADKLRKGNASPTLDSPFVLGAASIVPDPTSTDRPEARGVGDKPFDGKDGRPHAGPFVETDAERQRKKEQLEKDTPVKSDQKKSSSDKDHVGPDGQIIPHSNDGVMDDKNREGPKEGTTGTEGGVSEKSKEGQSGSEKKPDPPKEVPPLPHSEQQKMPEKGSKKGQKKEETDAKKDQVLAKPTDLPEAPHSNPPPSRPGKTEESLDVDDPSKHPVAGPGDKGHVDQHTNEIIQPLHSFVLSLAMIIFSEIGDKTFLVAALMAMRHPRMVVFSAAFSALVVMTVLSAILGHAVPTLIPKAYTNFLAAILFVVFGAKMLVEAKRMRPDENVSSEMKEVEMELEEKEHQQRRMSRRRSSITPYNLESGRAGMPRKSRSSNHRLPSPESISSSSSRGSSPSRNSMSSALTGINNLCSLLLSPAWVQTFVMTFLGEWGDRSQIATIAMAAGQDYWWVTSGAIIGHGLCTAGAVLGGRAVAGKVSIRVVTYGGAVIFLLFGVLYFFEAIY